MSYYPVDCREGFALEFLHQKFAFPAVKNPIYYINSIESLCHANKNVNITSL